nr:hypothetical protein CFP56_74636 [Quercus suber]
MYCSAGGEVTRDTTIESGYFPSQIKASELLSCSQKLIMIVVDKGQNAHDGPRPSFLIVRFSYGLRHAVTGGKPQPQNNLVLVEKRGGGLGAC